ncbi:MAG: Unknown protein [uncultured Sulfurovum sp.]|uniref:Uncharacterized protein n=1 Tax=uncultured Sulfurovum sp. TaxID=269237 RepID=A0A6S6SPD2_9BACT|nr:MAG: Unknown protein [uncultured Sulfurovum sp.]
MKNKPMTLLLFIIVLSMNVSANVKIDNALKKQCDYLVNGNGNNIEEYNTYLLGLITGMKYVIPAEEAKQYGKVTTAGKIKTKACENTLNHMTSIGFELDYLRETLTLFSTRYD